MEYFTAILFTCWLDKGMMACHHTVWPKVITSHEECLDILAKGIQVVETRGGTVIGYRCIDWTNQTDEQASI